MQPHLTVEQRQLALQLKARGWSLREISPQVGCAFQTFGQQLFPPGGGGQLVQREC